MSENRLAAAGSAYLQSAARQPIHWFPWGPEPFAAAKTKDRPVLLDIGAVWCHWCHVMDGESYEDPSLASFLNEHFICVKVDRDERPDVDLRYQRAVQAISGQGGWPLTAFLTPEGEVFFGGTYFPPDGKYGRPGFRSVLQQVLAVYRGQRERVAAQASALRGILEQHLDESMPGEAGVAQLDEAVEAMWRAFDQRLGGFGTQPKFPHPGAVRFLLTQWKRDPKPTTRQMVVGTLAAMARGGMHDHLGGGFHRYSVDAQWIVPHFEKMLSDNAELLSAYIEGYGAFATPALVETARGIVRWVREVMADAGGGYAASQDADVGLKDDGDYFTWTRDEAAAVLSPDELDVAGEYYDIGTAGEMHHNPAKNVLFEADTIANIALRSGRPESEAEWLLDSATAKLREARSKRPSPFVDQTHYTNWIALMAGALLRAAPVLEDDWAAEHALLTLERIQAQSPEADAVTHTPGGRGGLLEDQVFVAQAALDAYEATGARTWLEWSRGLMERVWREYWDQEREGLFDLARDAGGEGLLPARAKPLQDAPTPSANGVAGIVVARLSALTGNPIWQERGSALIHAFGGGARELGVHGATFLTALDWNLHPATHLVVVGRRDDPAAEQMHARALARYAPRRVIQRLLPEEVEGAALPPALRAMLGGGAPRAYACVGATCAAPAASDAAWVDTLASVLDSPNLPSAFSRNPS